MANKKPIIKNRICANCTFFVERYKTYRFNDAKQEWEQAVEKGCINSEIADYSEPARPACPLYEEAVND